MKARNPSTGNLESIYVKALDSLPVGSQIEFSGTDIPTGWEQVNDYSTTETDTGELWTDGRHVYTKLIEFGSLPNNSYKEVNHNIANVDHIWIAEGWAENSSGFSNQLSLYTPGDASGGWYFGVNKTLVRCQTGSDRTGYTGYVRVKYVKSS